MSFDPVAGFDPDVVDKLIERFRESPPIMIIPGRHRETCETYFAKIRAGEVPGPSRGADPEEWRGWVIAKQCANGQIQVVYDEPIPEGVTGS